MAKKNLLIIGARGYGREIYNYALNSKGYGTDFIVKGYLDDREDALEGFAGYPPIISSVEAYEIQPDDVFICALGDVKYKVKYSEIILNKGGEFINLISNQAYIGMNVKMGHGCIICPNSSLNCDIKLGDFVTLQPYGIIGHDVVVGDWCHINSYADCGGASIIGNKVTIHTHAFVFPKFKVGDNAMIGAGSLVMKNVKENEVVFGVPAKTLPIPKLNK